MKTGHASDEDIQQYLLDENGCEKNVREHIALCEICSAELVFYRMMFDGIANQPVPGFDVDLSDTVLSRIRQSRGTAGIKDISLFVVVCFTICITAGATYLLNRYMPNMFKGFSLLLTGVAIITALIIVIFQSVEMFKKYQDKINTLNFY